jgi:hypothetical protein
MAALPSIRDYHSVAFLLPSGQVAMADGTARRLKSSTLPICTVGHGR